jgi:hypothetical protein
MNLKDKQNAQYFQKRLYQIIYCVRYWGNRFVMPV